MTPAAALERTLHDEIPLSRSMGIRVASYNGSKLSLTAPLAPNINHKSTAFGGSLYSLAVLCGWGLVHLKLNEAGLQKHIVIQEADIRYPHPVTQDILAECSVEESVLQKFLRTLKKYDRARLPLDVIVKNGDQIAVEFSGRFVVHS